MPPPATGPRPSGETTQLTGGLDEATATVAGSELPTVPHAVVPSSPAVPIRAVPEMFPTELVQLPDRGSDQAWSQAPEPDLGPPSGLFPGWTGMHPGTGAGALAPRPARRRRALLAVVGVAVATVVVLVVALLLAPNWRGTKDADKDGQAATPVSSSSAGSSPAVPTVGGTTPQSMTVAPTGPAPTGTASTGPQRTVTVTATASTRPGSGTGGNPSSTPKTTATSRLAPTSRTTATSRTTTPATFPLGVPQRDIACSAGYIVQVASELDVARFKARVAALKAAGSMPAGAVAADAAKSCRIFTNQVNTLILYVGPFARPYDGCRARLAGPADSFIKGANEANSSAYVSCLCPAVASRLPQLTRVGQRNVWVGELQRVLGRRAGITITGLNQSWGVFTRSTQDAVAEFQRSARLPPSGRVDGSTWSALQRAEC